MRLSSILPVTFGNSLMNDAVFTMSINESIKVCQDCKVYKGQCSSDEERKVVMPPIGSLDDYAKYVIELQTRGEYDILLTDESMFQFEKLKKTIPVNNKPVKYDYFRYCFIQSPTKKISFEDYCDGIDEDEIKQNEEYYREMYENDNNQVYNNFPLYLRYDVDLKGYNPNSHSYAHLHIGFFDGFRMPVSILLTPKAFVCLALKLAYPESWKEEVVSHSNIKERVYAALKSQCLNDKNPYWEPTEENDLYLR